MIADCQLFPACSGCDLRNVPPDRQRADKLARVSALLENAGARGFILDFHQPAPDGLRDRLDFLLKDGAFGLYDRERNTVVDAPECPQLSPALAVWHHEFRRHLPPVPLASVRLRVAPGGTRGMWLDLPNIEIKKLLDEGGWLCSWPDDVVIEMGQRRKNVRRESSPSGKGRARFEDPVLRPWFRSLWRETEVKLYSTVGGFTQPSLRANLWINRWFQDQILRDDPERLIEFGTGSGNLSFPALSGRGRLTACETDRLGLQGFEHSLSVLESQGIELKSRVEIETGDFLRRSSPALEGAELLIANPPRSGLKAFLDPLGEARHLRTVLYMSCHPESFADDVPRLLKQGFRLERVDLLDQFPQTKHVETLSAWRRDGSSS